MEPNVTQSDNRPRVDPIQDPGLLKGPDTFLAVIVPDEQIKEDYEFVERYLMGGTYHAI